PLEDKLEEAVKQCRRFCRSKLKDWKIAKEGYADMPSVKGSSNKKEDRSWKFDCWLPKTLARVMGKHNDMYRKGGELYHYNTVLEKYANKDSEITLAVWMMQERELKERGLWEIFEEVMKQPSVLEEMETYGMTLSIDRLDELKVE